MSEDIGNQSVLIVSGTLFVYRIQRRVAGLGILAPYEMLTFFLECGSTIATVLMPSFCFLEALTLVL